MAQEPTRTANASIAVEKPSLHASRITAAAVVQRIRQTLGDVLGRHPIPLRNTRIRIYENSIG
jgi:hypothetical protein